MGRLGNRPSIFLPFNCSGASMVDNAFFIVGWLLVLVLSLDRRFLLTLRRPVCGLPITLFALAVVERYGRTGHASANLSF
jgi:hypothetical protein